MIIRRKHRNGERGQVLILCALSLVVLLLFVGLAIDFGMAYVTKAKLGKALDAAALVGARYSARGPDGSVGPTGISIPGSTALAQSTFAMNYGPGAPAVSVTYPNDATGTSINVTATSTIPTFFIGMLPQFRTLDVKATAQARASRVGMTLVLDRSGSMYWDGGGTNLPGALQTFIGYFDDQNDNVALVTFATTAGVPNAIPGNAALPDVAMNTHFTSAITDITTKMITSPSTYFNGHTFSDGALQMAYALELPITSGQGKVVVFFTDGGANTVQNTLTCGSGLASGVWNFGGQDPPSTAFGYMDPYSGADQNKGCGGATFPSVTLGGMSMPWDTGGTQVPMTYANVQAEAFARAVADADAMRQQVPPVTVYAIGLGIPPNSDDSKFLCQVANDPCSTTYKASVPTGVYQAAATGADLAPAFQAIATIIRLRITQ